MIQANEQKIAELKIEMAMTQINSFIPSYFTGISNCYEQPKKTTLKELDKIIFPINPIRDYIEKLMQQIELKYEKYEKIKI